jgi:hypothetical protein
VQLLSLYPGMAIRKSFWEELVAISRPRHGFSGCLADCISSFLSLRLTVGRLWAWHGGLERCIDVARPALCNILSEGLHTTIFSLGIGALAWRFVG